RLAQSPPLSPHPLGHCRCRESTELPPHPPRTLRPSSNHKQTPSARSCPSATISQRKTPPPPASTTPPPTAFSRAHSFVNADPPSLTTNIAPCCTGSTPRSTTPRFHPRTHNSPADYAAPPPDPLAPID